MTTEHNELMTVREAADLVGVSPAAVYNRIEARQLNRKHVFGTIVVPRLEVQAWKKEREDDARRVLSRKEG